jgi:hypothetical protein
VCLWIYINLALTGLVKSPRRPRRFMWATLSVWSVSLALGIQLYLRIWRPVSSFWLYAIPLIVLGAVVVAAASLRRVAAAAVRARIPGGMLGA